MARYETLNATPRVELRDNRFDRGRLDAFLALYVDCCRCVVVGGAIGRRMGKGNTTTTSDLEIKEGTPFQIRMVKTVTVPPPPKKK